MVLTRKLTDLYVTGQELVLDDGRGEVKVYIRKITPVDSEAAYRAANAAKTRAMTIRTDPDDPMYLMIAERSESATKDDMVENLALLEVQKKSPVIEAELEAEDKWSKDDYLQGLHDAWESGLKEKYHSENPDEETKRVFAEMQAFNDELEKRLQKELEAERKNFKSLSHEKVKDKFFDAQIERHADIAWLAEYRKQELFHAVRDPDDHDVRAFSSPEEIEEASAALIEQLREAYQALSIDPLEGKD